MTKAQPKPGDARTVAAALERANNPLGAAIVYGVLGERDLTFRLLEAAYEERDSNMPWIQSDPNLRTLSDDPRFGALLRRMNLPLVSPTKSKALP